ncbi:TPA: ead/Ea22-like family protein [Klebsiella pneumoniae]
MTDITELAQSLKAAAEKAGIEQWVNNLGEVNTADYEVDGGVYIDHICDCEIVGTESPRAEFIALANPANILALVEELEKAQRYTEELREWNAGLAQESFERQQMISELVPIRAAAEKLVRCKGRYHSEQNYRALAALFGVKTPDLPPLDSESRTVKLTDINEFLAEVHDKTLNRAFRLLAEGVRAGDVAAMRAAGIKVEAE